MAKSTRTQQPITRHPLFPAIVALWFGALFGLGSLAIRATLLESAVVATGIDLLVPAAAPPLGVTARILLALALALVGGLIGVTIGLRMGRVKAEPPQRRRTSLAAEEPPLLQRADAFTYAEPEAPRRPLSAFEDLPDNEQIDQAVAEDGFPLRRRQLAMEEPTRPDYARAFAPLPGAAPDASEFGVLDLAEPIEDQPDQPAEWAAETTVTASDHQPEIAPAYEPAAAPLRRFDAAPAAAFTSAPEIEAAAPAMIRRFDGPAAEAEEDDRGLPPRNLRQAAPPPVPAATPAPEPALQIGSEPVSAAAFEPGSGSAAEQLRAAALETLSHIQLIERLALSMQQRREAALAAAAAPAPLAEPAAPLTFEPIRFGFEPKEPIELPEVIAPFAPPSGEVEESAPAPARAFDDPAPAPQEEPAFAPPAMPAAMRPIGFDLEDEPEDEPVVTPQRFAFAASSAAAAPSLPPVAGDDEMDAEDAADESYSSLLGLGSAPLRQPLVRIDEPVDEAPIIEPVVVFPGHGSRPFAAPAPAAPKPAPEPAQPGVRRFDAPAAAAQPSAARIDPEETERALRAALATLQRMSGAA